jgi:hypothetical protein
MWLMIGVKVNLNWPQIMKTVQEDPYEFFKEGGWSFLSGVRVDKRFFSMTWVDGLLNRMPLERRQNLQEKKAPLIQSQKT